MKRILSVLCLCACLHVAAQEIDTWSSPPDTISSLGVDSSSPHVGMDDSGNVVAVWLEGDVVVSKTKLLAGSWSSADTLSGSGSSSPQVVVDPTTGNATAIWNEGGLIKSANKPFGSAWGSITTLSASSSSSPQIAIDSATGDVVAVWVTSGVVKSDTQLFGMSWSGSPDTLSSADSAFPQVAIGSDGTVVAVWHTLNGITSLYNVNAATKAVGGAWSSSTLVSDPIFNSVYPQVAVDPNGNAIIAWYRYNLSGSVYSNVVLQSSYLPFGGSWATPVDISAPGIGNPADLVANIFLGDSGSALAVWTTVFNGSTFTLQSSGSADYIQWDDPTTLDASLYSYSIDVATNSIGDAFGIYMTYDSGSDTVLINASESRLGLINSGFWTSPVGLSVNEDNAYPVIKSVLTSGTDCNAIAAWISFDGSNNVIQTSTGTGTAVIPPTDPLVSQFVNDKNVFEEFYNVISWTASTDPNLVSYGIYRNGVFIDFVFAPLVSYIDHNQAESGSVTYGVSAFDNASSESAVITVSFP